MVGVETWVCGADSDSVAAGAVTRTWSDSRGLQLKATLYAFDGATVKLRKADGTILPVAIDKMSATDQQVLAQHPRWCKEAQQEAACRSRPRRRRQRLTRRQ